MIIKKTIPYRSRGKQNGTVLGGTVFKGPVLGGGGSVLSTALVLYYYLAMMKFNGTIIDKYEELKCLTWLIIKGEV